MPDDPVPPKPPTNPPPSAVSLNFQRLNATEDEDTHVGITVTGESGFQQSVQLTRLEAFSAAQQILEHWPSAARHFGLIK